MNQPLRRTMSDALRPLPPEAVAVIKEGSPRPQTPRPTISAVPPVTVTSATATAKSTTEAAAPIKTKPQKAASEESAALVAVNFRVPESIPQTLLKASADRKLKKVKPYTNQGIVTEALAEWFQKNGYKL